MQALHAAQQEQLPRALQLLEENTHRYPKHVASWQLLADVAHDRARMDRELDACRRLIRLSPHDVPTLVRLGNLYLSLEWYAQAEPLFGRALQIAPDDPRAIIGQVSYWYIVNTPRKSIARLQQALRKHPENDQFWHALAENHLSLSEYAQAEQAARRGLQANPQNLPLRKELAQILLATGRLPEAEAALRQVLQERPGDLDSVYLLGTAIEQQGRTSEAQHLYETIANVPGEPNPALYRLGRLYLRQGRQAEGKALLARHEQAKQRQESANDLLQRLWKHDTAADHYAVAILYQHRKDIPRAIIEAERTLELAPQHRSAKRLLQQLSRQEGKTH
jgi:tetratricopeptide (TPR) repeat protein